MPAAGSGDSRRAFYGGRATLPGAASFAFGEETRRSRRRESVEPSTATPERLSVATPSPAATPVAYLSVAGSVTETPSPTPVPTTAPVTLWAGAVDRSAQRSGPSKKDACLSFWVRADVVQLLSDEAGEWRYVQTDQGKQGYLDAAQAQYYGTQSYTLTPPAPSGWEELPRCAVTDCCDTTLRYEARLDLQNNEIGKLSPGEIVRVVAVEGLYFHVVRASTGQTGYMLSSALEPVDPIVDWAVAGGVVGYDTTSYTHEEMLRDIAGLTERYGEWLRVVETGRSLMGREIPLLRLGGESASMSLFIQASIHAREFATTMLLMEQMEDLLIVWRANRVRRATSCGRCSAGAVYAVPMANPDGVAISQWEHLRRRANGKPNCWLGRSGTAPATAPIGTTTTFPPGRPTRRRGSQRNFDARWRYSSSAPPPDSSITRAQAFSEPESRFLAHLLEGFPSTPTCPTTRRAISYSVFSAAGNAIPAHLPAGRRPQAGDRIQTGHRGGVHG
jgi:hypothetical protein